MDAGAVREALDQQLRRGAAALWPGERVDAMSTLCASSRPVGSTACCGGDLDADSADSVIAGQIERFAAQNEAWEWKHYSYEEPADLPDRLRAAGLHPEEAEALLAVETARLPRAAEPPPGVEVGAVHDRAGVERFTAVHEEVFGGDSAWIGRMLLADLGLERPRAWGAVALAGAGDGRRGPPGTRASHGLRRAVQRVHPRRVARQRRLPPPPGALRPPGGGAGISLHAG